MVIRSLAVAAVLAAAPAVHAAFIVDNFDTNPVSGRLDAATSLSDNAGWAGTGYVSGSTTVTLATGLTFTNPAYADANVGKSVQISNNGRAGGRELAASLTGTVWMSYLVHMYSSNQINASVGLRQANTWPGYATAVDGVDYTWNGTASVYESGGADLATGQTYLAIARFVLDAGGSSLTAWHFAPSDAIPTTEAGLNALLANQFTKTNLANLSGGTANFVVYHGAGNRVDAVRISDASGDAGVQAVLGVTPIPEPASLGLLTLGAAALLRRRR